jgi:hypothetical protein
MSRRKRRRDAPSARGEAPAAGSGRAERGRRDAAVARDASASPSSRPAPGSGWGLGVQVAFLAAIFAIVVLVAELAGAANLGVALGVGQIAFAIAVMYLLLRR